MSIICVKGVIDPEELNTHSYNPKIPASIPRLSEVKENESSLEDGIT